MPYGLVRFGVAPDHPEVKNVINTFEKIAKNSRVRFMGNINVGQDISLEELKDNYHVLLLVIINAGRNNYFVNVEIENISFTGIWL